MSGLSPFEHGWLGWDMYMKEYDSVITLFTNLEKETKEEIKGYKGTYNILPINYLTDKVSKKDGYLGSYVSLYGNIKYKDIDDMNEKTMEITKNDKKNYIYAYYDEPDYTMHEFGTNSIESKEKYKLIDMKFKELCDKLSSFLIIMIADHGHINISKWLTLTDYPEIIDMLKDATAIDSRASSFRVKEERKRDFEYEIKKILKDDFILMSKKEVIKNEIFGSGLENHLFKDGIGDYIAIAVGDKAIRYSNRHEEFKSAHAGITLDEVYVPLVMVKKK